MNDSFKRGAREGFRLFLPMSVGLVPWAIVTGIAMRSIGLSPVEAMGMNLIVYAGTFMLKHQIDKPLEQAIHTVALQRRSANAIHRVCADQLINLLHIHLGSAEHKLHFALILARR
jgi:hypothetical protein